MSYAVNSKKIAKNTIALYVRLGVTMVIMFFMTREMLRQLGVEDYGLNNLVGSIVSMFSFINGSMGTAVQRFYSIEIGKEKEDRLKRVFGVGLYLHIIVALITFLFCEIFAIFFLHKMNIPAERMFAAHVVFQVSILSLTLNIVNVPYAALLRAREMFSKTAVVEMVQAFLRLGVLFLLIHIDYDKLITLSILNLGITLYFVGTLTVMARKFEEAHSRPMYDKGLIKQMLTFVSMLIITVLAQLLKTQGIIILVNLFFGLVVNAAYAVAVQVSHMVNSFVLNFKQSVIPQMTAAYGNGDKAAMHKIINTGTKIGFLLLLMFSIPVIFEGQFLLNIWLGTPPSHSAKLVVLVLIAINISSFTYFQYQGVHATGRIVGQQIWMSSAFVANIAIIYVFFKLGASFETALYVNMAIGVIQACVNLYYAHKCYDYNVESFIKSILLPCLVVLLAVVFSMFMIVTNIHPSTGRFLGVLGASEAMICTLGYFVLLDCQERVQVRHLINKCLKR